MVCISFSAVAQQGTKLVAGADWQFPGLTGPIPALQAPLGTVLIFLAVANNGDLLIADRSNHLVLRLSADGMVRVVVGNGTNGYSGDGGPAVGASLIGPDAIAIDRQENLYISESGFLGGQTLCHIRRVTVDGMISTLQMQTDTCGAGLAIDPADHLVVSQGFFVKRLNGDGSSTTIAGNGTGAGRIPGSAEVPSASAIGDGGPATTAMLLPGPIAYDAPGNLYIAEPGGLRIRKVDTNGIISTIAGLGSSPPSNGQNAASAGIGVPVGLAINANGTVYFSEQRGGGGAGPFTAVIRKISDGTLSTAVDLSAILSSVPIGLAIDSSGAIVMTVGDRVVRASSAGAAQMIAGNGCFRSTGDGGPAREAPVYALGGVVADDQGNLYFSEYLGNRVRKVSVDGTISTIAGTGLPGYSGDGGPATNAQLWEPWNIAVDHRGGLYVSDSSNYKIRHITWDGAISTVPIPSGADLTVDPQGNLYVAAGDKVYRLSPDGRLMTFAGADCEGATTPLGDSQFVNICLLNPHAVVADSQGNLYICDFYSRIRVVDSSGRVSTYADYSAVFYTTHLAIDAGGSLFASGSNGFVYRIQAGGATRLRLYDASHVYTLTAANGALLVADGPGFGNPTPSMNTRVLEVITSPRSYLSGPKIGDQVSPVSLK
jgi:sugar lactone lactonase YvrE